ncbi:MAG: TonB-dependent receptor [Calditrichaeota bacterium]|nr:TonB-dependent receptor [Calditrichota bacterium]
MSIAKRKLAWIIVILLWATSSVLWAGTTGKIVGIVTDKQTGEPLPGANVIIERKPYGAATDLEGAFLIMNIPPGYYDISAQMIGYQKLIKENIMVMADRTVIINFELESATLETEAIVVQAERPMVRRDETNKAAILDFEVFQDMPIQEFDEAVAAQVGIVTDEAGDLHLRGGRAGEIAYLIDGILVQDPFYKSGAADINLDKYLIQELQLQTGAFGAEYGQAMSGVINIVTREGDQNKYSFRMEYESPQINNSPYRKVDWMLHSDMVDVPPGQEDAYRDSWRFYAQPGDTTFSTTPTPYDPIGVSQYKVPRFESIPKAGDLPRLFGNPVYGFFTSNFSGPIPFVKKLSFFASSRYSNIYSYLPFGYDSRRDYNVKFTYRPLNVLKINASIQRSRRYYKPYSHLWKYRPFALEDRQNIVNRETLEITHTINPNSFYTLRLSRYYHRFYRFNPNRKFKISDYPEEIWSDPQKLDSVIVADNSDWEKGTRNSDGFYVRGDRGRYEDNKLTTYAAKIDYVNQLNRRHEIKSGFEYKYHTVDRDRWRYPWPGSAHYVEIFTYHPEEFSTYIQDKMEYERFVLNLGLRYDYFDPHATMWEDIYTPGYLDDDTGEWIPAKEVPAKPKQHISPRIGIAYPVTEKMVFHSSYGHFYENPSFYNMYKHHDVTVGGIPLVGNPSIKSQKTVQYEFGVKVQIASNWSFDVNAYFKDITNLAASTYRLVFPYNFTVFDNSDYASVKGIDFTLEKRMGRFFTGVLNYSISVARGNESSASDGYNNYRGVDVTLRPNREYYLDFDRRHDISMNAIFKTPKNFGPRLFGSKIFASWNLNLLIQAASGLPYTPFVEESAENVFVERNTGRKPWYSQVDLRLQKTTKLTSSISLSGFLIVKNLFNRLNENYVWSRTGRAWDAGPTSSYSQDRIHNPANVSILRQISFGFRFLFSKPR